MRIKKFNGGSGAILCNTCRVIVMEGNQITKDEWESDELVICNRCKQIKDLEDKRYSPDQVKTCEN